MAELVLFHHVLGPTAGLDHLAGRLREAGHVVHSPDLFDGERFESIDDGAAHVDSIGIPTLIRRAEAAATDLPDGVVYAGISLGVVAAQYLAQTRVGARGAALLESCLPATEFGDGWPIGVPVQIHGMSEDPFFAGEGDIDNAREIVSEVGTPIAELFEYPGDAHLFTDSSLSSFDAAATDVVVDRLTEFLARIDRSS
ncbi:MAG: dienelactone hydrolase family protein [Actinomycetota bacterium]